MIYKLKKILQSILPQSIYLKCLHIGFRFCFKTGLLKNNYIYKYHYFVKNLIKEGDTVLDIGANLGYFSTIFIKLIGNSGKLYSVEPIPMFYTVLQWALRGKKNVSIYNNALGAENTAFEMYIPTENGYFNTGLAHVPAADEDTSNGLRFTVQAKKASELFQSLEKINYIKCDIEGYEEVVIPEMLGLIKKHLPILQIETWGVHKQVVFDSLHSIGYENYSLYKGELIKNFDDSIEYGDFIFIHPQQK